MNNLGLSMVQFLVPAYKYDIKCPNAMQPQYLTIHNTANDASARAEISYMIGNNHEVSYHWAVDDVEAIQAILHNRNAWHCGDGQGTGNMTSIGIEICHSLTPGNPRYAKAEDNGAKLAAIILQQQGWGIDRMRKHQDWSGKYCPHRILDNQDWDNFKAKVQGYLDQLNQPEEITEILEIEGENDMLLIHFKDALDGFKKDGIYLFNFARGTYNHLANMEEVNFIKKQYPSIRTETAQKGYPCHVRYIQAFKMKEIK